MKSVLMICAAYLAAVGVMVAFYGVRGFVRACRMRKAKKRADIEDAWKYF